MARYTIEKVSVGYSEYSGAKRWTEDGWAVFEEGKQAPVTPVFMVRERAVSEKRYLESRPKTIFKMVHYVEGKGFYYQITPESPLRGPFSSRESAVFDAGWMLDADTSRKFRRRPEVRVRYQPEVRVRPHRRKA